MKRIRIIFFILFLIFAVFLFIIYIKNLRINYTGSNNAEERFILYTTTFINAGLALNKKFIYIPQDQNIESKIGVFKDFLEKRLFDNNNLDFRFDKENYRLIVNFSDNNTTSLFQSKWNNYFQGTTGSYITYMELLCNLLQPEYNEAWIKELEFKYNNKPFPEMDHIILTGIITKKDLKNNSLLIDCCKHNLTVKE